MSDRLSDSRRRLEESNIEQRRAEELCRRLQHGLRRELDRRHGQIGNAESRIGRSPGYLRRLAAGHWQPSIDAFFEAVLGLGVDPNSFLERNLEMSPTPEAMLLELEEPAADDRSLRQIEQTIALLEHGERVEPRAPRQHLDDAGCATEIASLDGLSRNEQRRRLRKKKLLRQELFVDRLLDHLNDKRLRTPHDIVQLIPDTVGLLASINAPRRVVLNLAARALGVFGAAARQIGQQAKCARALRAGLELTTRHDLDEQRGWLLCTTVNLVLDNGDVQRGRFLLREAGEIFADLDDDFGRGAVLLSRGVLASIDQRWERSNRLLERARDLFARAPTPASRECLKRHYLTGIDQRRSVNHQHRGNLDEAIAASSAARAHWRDEPGLVLGQLLWNEAMLNRDAAKIDRALDLFDQAASILEQTSAYLDLFAVKLEQAYTLVTHDRGSELDTVVHSAMPLAEHLEENREVHDLLRQFLTLGLEGRLDTATVHSLLSGLASRRGAF
ncbi:MAG: hypothetical protein AAGD38_07915 [Acidobacteriota bacterium]